MAGFTIFRRALLAVACALAPLLALQGAAQADWVPQKPVQFVIMAGKGGGADKMARMFQRIIELEELAPVPFEPVNMPEGNGAEALQYLVKNKGNPHVIMVTLNSFYTTPIRDPNLNIDVTTFTPVGRMGEDTFLLWVHADSGINTFEEFVQTASSKGEGWVMAGTGTASEDNLITDFLNQAYGLRMTYKPFKGGGEVAHELADKKADSTVNNPSEQEGIYEEGRTRPLAAFTPTRLENYPDVPAMREAGNDFSYFMQRSVVAAPGISADAARYYQQLFRDVYESKQWQDYMNRNSLYGDFLTGEALRNYWADERELHRKLLAGASKTN